MNLTIACSTLNEALDLTTRFVSKHATLPILENIYLKASIDTLLLKATDMEKHIEMSIPANITNDGTLTVNARTFASIIKTIDDDQVQLLLKDETLIIKSSTDTFEIKGIPSSEYVALPEVSNENSITIEASSIITGIEKVEFTVSEKNFSPVLTGVYMRILEKNEKKYLIFVGSDSFRLAEYKIPVTSSLQDMSLIIPKTNIGDIKKTLEYYTTKEGGDVTINFSDNMVAFRCKTPDGIQLLTTSLLIQWHFPDYNNENIMPTHYNLKILADKDALERAVRKILIMTKDINNFVLIETKDNKLIINSGDTDKWAAMTSLPAITDGDSITVGINGKYINEFVKTSSSSEIAINIVDNQKPLVFKDRENDNYTYIARPLLK